MYAFGKFYIFEGKFCICLEGNKVCLILEESFVYKGYDSDRNVLKEWSRDFRQYQAWETVK